MIRQTCFSLAETVLRARRVVLPDSVLVRASTISDIRTTARLFGGERNGLSPAVALNVEPKG